MPVTVMVYLPGGVPPLGGGIGAPPPQAASKMIPADNTENSNKPSSFLVLVVRSGFRRMQIPNHANPATGNHRAYIRLELPNECGSSRAVGATVEIVRVEVAKPSAAGVTDIGAKTQVGAARLR